MDDNQRILLINQSLMRQTTKDTSCWTPFFIIQPHQIYHRFAAWSFQWGSLSFIAVSVTSRGLLLIHYLLFATIYWEKALNDAKIAPIGLELVRIFKTYPLDCSVLDVHSINDHCLQLYLLYFRFKLQKFSFLPCFLTVRALTLVFIPFTWVLQCCRYSEDDCLANY